MASPIENFLNTVGLGDIMRKQAPAPTIQQSQDQMTGVGAMSPQELEGLNAQARQAGYPDYASMKLKMQQMRRPGAGPTPLGTMANRTPGSVMQEGMDNAMNLHPKTIFQKISDAVEGALGRNQ